MDNRVVRSICGFCHTNCGVNIRLQDGKISRIEGDPEHPGSRGHLCPKAQAIKPLLESKDRLKFPLKKTKGGFARVSWDEALDFAAERLTKVRDTYGPEGLFHGHGAPVTYGARDGFLQFMGAFGSPNFTGVANTCHVPRLVAFVHAFGGRPEPDFENTNLVMLWGSNPANTTRFASYAAYDGFNLIVPRLKKRGAKIVIIDPVRSESVSFADEWNRPNLATDSALGLAMIHTIIAESLYDREFVSKWVVGFDEIKKHVETMTPEWAETITSVPADRIREVARLYATADGAIIVDGNGLDMHTNGVDMVRVLAILIALTGNIDKRGGNVYFSIIPQTPLPTIKSDKKRMALEQFPLFPQTPFPAFKESLLSNAPDRPRAMVVHHSNPVLVQANRERTKQALQKLDFLMVIDVFPTATTEIADLVLPAAADLEAVDYRAFSSTKGGFLAFREKVFEPMGEAKSVFAIEYELADRMGIAKDYPFRNDEEWINFVLQPAKVTLDVLRNNHIVYASPPIVYHKYAQDGFKTPSKKVECLSQRFQDAGYGALPAFVPPKESPVTPEYPLLGTTRKPAEFVHTKLVNLPTAGRKYSEPQVRINPTDASRKSIRDGDLVKVQSLRGAAQFKAKVTEEVVPGMVSVDFGYGNPTDGKSAVNFLTNDGVWDPVSGGTPNRLFLCNVESVLAT